MNFFVYIDGSCLDNPGKGGIGVIISRENIEYCFCVPAKEKTTNNRMELDSMIFALEKILKIDDKSKNENIEITTDSQYLAYGWSQLGIWSNNSWKKKDKKPVLNQDLWQELLILKENFTKIQIIWVLREKNVRADCLAQLSTVKNLCFSLKIIEEIALQTEN
jgi:ribonuclease HI